MTELHEGALVEFLPGTPPYERGCRRAVVVRARESLGDLVRRLAPRCGLQPYQLRRRVLARMGLRAGRRGEAALERLAGPTVRPLSPHGGVPVAGFEDVPAGALEFPCPPEQFRVIGGTG